MLRIIFRQYSLSHLCKVSVGVFGSARFGAGVWFHSFGLSDKFGSQVHAISSQAPKKFVPSGVKTSSAVKVRKGVGMSRLDSSRSMTTLGAMLPSPLAWGAAATPLISDVDLL